MPYEVLNLLKYSVKLKEKHHKSAIDFTRKILNSHSIYTHSPLTIHMSFFFDLQFDTQVGDECECASSKDYESSPKPRNWTDSLMQSRQTNEDPGDWIAVAEDRDQLLAYERAVMNLPDP